MQTNTRPLLARPDHIEIAPSAIKRGLTTCDFCAFRDICKLPVPDTPRCGAFAPVLWFIPPLVGFEGRFSTIRVSAVWSDRMNALPPGNRIVGLGNVKRRERFGSARVVDVASGRYGDLIQKFAHTNHLMIAQGLTGEAARKELNAVCRQMYGPNMLPNEDRQCTVIFCERIQAGARVKEAWPMARKRGTRRSA
jgi:hypothetical protein